MTTARKWKLVFRHPQGTEVKGNDWKRMSLAERETMKRDSVRGVLEKLESDVQTSVERSLLTRQELFGPVTDRSEEGFQQRCLMRMCKLGILDSLIVHPTRARVYAVRDSSKVLDA